MRRVALDGGIYTRECVAEAARTLAGRAEVKLPRVWGARPAVTLGALDATAPAELEAELLDEALSVLYRRAVSAFHAEAARPALERAAASRAPETDHSERLEPDLARDRRRELDALAERARAMEAARE